MTSGGPSDLRARMARLLDKELMERAGARLSADVRNKPDPDNHRETMTEFPIAERLAQDVWKITAAALRLPQDQLDPQENLANLGIDSIAITEVMVQISRHLSLSVAPTIFFEAKNIDDLSEILFGRHGGAITAHYEALDASTAKTQVLSEGIEAPASLETAPATQPAVTSDPETAWLSRHQRAAQQSRKVAAQGTKDPAHMAEVSAVTSGLLQQAPDVPTAAPIAILSMEGMFPKSPDLKSFEAHLAAGNDCIEEIPADRWDWRAVHGDPKKGAFTDVKYGGFVPHVDMFDAAFFNISPREAELMDPQHRLFMECVWHLVEKGGYAPGSLSGRKVGLFVGLNLLDYTNMVNQAGIMEAQQLTGIGHAFCPNRLSFLLDIHGPSEVIDTACSSSLVAIHRAVMSIRHEGCEMAIAGGSNLMLSPKQHIMFSKVGMITPEGRCKTFSKDADGYARADGVGAVLLKRLDLAERDGDPILGVITGSAEHHGGGATSLTAPNPRAQARLIVDAHRQAGGDPRTIGLIECHGTGTPLGDPVEIEGLKLAFEELYQDHKLDQPAEPLIGLGSVKSNIGHAETAAGVAGLIKVLLSLKAATRFQTLHCADPNPLLDLDESPFHLLQAATAWPQPVVDGIEQPRRAGLSSFGAGGTNVHLVVEEYRQAGTNRPSPGPTPMVVPVSAKSDAALQETIALLLEAVRAEHLPNIACTLQIGRDAMRVRVAFVAETTAELVAKMQAFLAGDQKIASQGQAPAGRREKRDALDPTGSSAQSLAEHWVVGGDVDWSKLYGPNKPHRIALPGYAFQRKRFWLPDDAVAAVVPAPTLQPVRQGNGCYAITFTGQEHFLADHKVAGKATLPGVAYLEIARKAAEGEGFLQPRLQQVVWMAPLIVEETLCVHCDVISGLQGTARVEISTQTADGERLLHAQMRVSSGVESQVQNRDLAALRNAAKRQIGMRDIYAAFDTMGLDYGGSHRVLKELFLLPGVTGETEILARLELPDHLISSLGAFDLHPSLLDGALQAAIGLTLDEKASGPETAALPFAIESVDVSGACEAVMWAHVRPQAEGVSASKLRKMDIDVVAGDGSVRASLKGFSTRTLAEPVENEVLRFYPVWHPLEIAPIAGDDRRKIVLLAAAQTDPEQLQRDLDGWDCRALDDNRGQSGSQRYSNLARQVMAIAQKELKGSPLLLQLVFENDDRDQPLSGLAGMLRSIAKEHPKISGQIVCLKDAFAATEVAHALRQAAKAPSGAVLQVRAEGLSMELWQETAAARAPSQMPWVSDGVYLITGGAGKLGRLLAGDILKQVPNATMVLAGRRAPGSDLAQWIERHRNLKHLCLDLSDDAAVSRAVSDIRRAHGKIDGVIHAAGALQDGAFASKTPAQLAAVLAPKVSGVVALDKALGKDPLDFFVLFSSISGAVGNAGQADYAAANSFLDGFAAERERRREEGHCQGKTVSIAWPLWRDGGMGLDEDQQKLMQKTTGLVPMETRAGLEALYAAVSGDASRMLIAVGNAAKIRSFINVSLPRVRVANRPNNPAVAAITETAVQTSPVNAADLYRHVLVRLFEETGAQLKVPSDELDPDVELTEYGFDSIGFTQFANHLNDRFDLDLTPTLFFEFPTLDGLARYLSEEQTEHMAKALGVVPQAATPATDTALPLKTSKHAAEISGSVATDGVQISDASSVRQDEAVAIIGMSCQFPGAPDADAFWDVLKEGRDCIGEIPAERWNWRDYWGDPLSEPGRGNVKWGGFIEGMAEFDASFFGISAPEARMMDPQQRLLLTQAWRVMEDAGYAPSSLGGSRTGVFIGTADTGYSRLISDAGTEIEGYSMTGLAPSLGPNRISYYYDFHGPSVAVETACSSALIAVHRAVEAIRSGHCRAAIAGGINALLLPEAFVGFSKAGMLSPGGKCKSFSADADGYARGEGVGLVFLKPLAEAERDGDRVLAVIRASAENHGGHAASLTAPNPKAQADLLRTAYAQAGFDPRSVTYLEAHGTGTPLGDPIEVEALKAAFADLARDAEMAFGPAPEQVCTLGSVKSNIGHLELAAGAAGLIKVLLQIRHGEIARSLHCDVLNPYLKLKDSPFRVAQSGQTWDRPTDGDGATLPRRAGVSSFGFGGSNAHIVVEEYVPAQPYTPPATLMAGPELIVLSAKSEAQLKEAAAQLATVLASSETELALSDIAHTLQLARDPMEFRLGFLAETHDQLRERLRSFADGKPAATLHIGRVASNRKTITVLETDNPLREAAAGLASRGRADDLLALWVGGFGVDWKSVRRNLSGKRIALPGYPFAKTSFWVGQKAGAAPRTPDKSSHHFHTTVFGTESFLRDHLVLGDKVLPGVMCFELLSAALSLAEGHSEAFELIGHGWTEALRVENGPVNIEVTFQIGHGDDRQYRIAASGVGGAMQLAQGVARPLQVNDVPRVELDRARQMARNEVATATLYRRFADMGLQYGPAQQSISGLWQGTDRVVARLTLPEAADRDLALNPAILDGALQAVLALQDDIAGSLALPFSVRRVQVFGKTVGDMWAVLVAGDSGISVDICDEQGWVKVRLEDFTARNVEAHSSGIASGQSQALSAVDRTAKTLELVTDIAAQTLEVEPSELDVEAELGDFGFDSITMTAFSSRINAGLGLALTPADFFEFSSLSRLADHIADDLTDEQLGVTTASAHPFVGKTTVAASRSAERVWTESPASGEQLENRAPGNDDPIVIVGYSGAFPLARDLDAFWANLIAGRDCISRIPEDRWNWRAIDGDPKQHSGKTNIHWGGFNEGVFEFDPLFFNISPREAKLMDPQQRLMLLHAWKAIEDAGHSPKSLAGQKVGVFVGTSSSGYDGAFGDDTGSEGYVATGSVASVGPNRISYFLDLHGPSEPVETACSSSLVALHRAIQAIEAGDCDMALVGGVNTILTPDAHINFAKAGMLSPDGRCKTFSDKANGYVRGEGAGMLFLRRRSDAVKDGDPILANVLATAINHGGHANSLTAPNTQAQADLLIAAYKKAGIDPRTIGYIEVHGTGTALGDPVEINALKSALANLPETTIEFAGQGIGLGSVKTNIGHLELAAGVAGIIKVLMQLQHKQLAPSLHCEKINPYIDLNGTPFRIVRNAQTWEPVRDSRGSIVPLRAGVSSFGFGGVNAHAVLEEHQPNSGDTPASTKMPSVGPLLYPLSARDATRLRDVAGNLVAFLEDAAAGSIDPEDLAFTLQVGRAPLNERLAIVAGSVEEFAERLRTFLVQGSGTGSASGIWQGRVAPGREGQKDNETSASLADLARRWVIGGQVAWGKLTAGPHKRLRLPTYPFARDVYRVGPGLAEKTASERPSDASANNCFQTVLDADAFYLRDHRIHGERILPGAMSLALACEAGLEKTSKANPVLRFSNLTWRTPVELDAGKMRVQIPLMQIAEEAWSLSLMSGDEAQTEHMRCELRTEEPASEQPQILLDDLQQDCQTEHDPDWLYASYSVLGIEYGPAFRAIRQVTSGVQGVLAKLQLPQAAVRENHSYGLHPSLMDAAFHAALVLFSEDDESVLALPYGIENIVVFGETVETMWAHLRARPSGSGLRKLDIDLADETGKVLVRIEGFSLRLLKQQGPASDRSRSITSAPKTPDKAAVERYFVTLVARETEIEASVISLAAPLEDYGIDSILITRMTDELERDFGTLPKTLFFEHQTLGSLIDHFSAHHADALTSLLGSGTEGSSPALPAAVRVPQKTERAAMNEPIAIIGLAGRYPGGRTLDEFWQNLANGADSISEIPGDRWDHSLYFDPERKPGKTTSKWGGFVDGHDRFDPLFFNIAPREAQFMDPQERLFLQCAWEVLEDSGYTRSNVAPSAADGLSGGDVGVFAGVMWEEYQLYGPERSAQGQSLSITGNPASIANRVSYFLNFHGPSIAVDSMCSSSLTAIHLACESLRAGGCSVALAGGVNLTPHPNKYVALSQSRFLSSTGRCESFGEGGDGYVPAEGVGAVLLKPLSQAEADGDRIYGVILGSALNHGGKTNGYTVPNPAAQASVIEKAIRHAGVQPHDISYIEAHGTGTSLGDPIEIAALKSVFAHGPQTERRCSIGSVKSNIGHAESAAGIVGLTKVLLQMKHGRLVPSLHSGTTNPNIDFEATPFKVQQQLEPWAREERSGQSSQRIAGLSSFGAGGSNAHFILGEYEGTSSAALPPRTEIFPFSARSAEQLQAVLRNVHQALLGLDAAQLPSVAHTLQQGREAFEERLAIIADGRLDLIAKLERVLAEQTGVSGVFKGTAPHKRPLANLAGPLGTIADAWVQGASVDWAALRKGPKPQPVSLPTYPFAEDYCWLPEMDAQPTSTPPAKASDIQLPLILTPVWQDKPIMTPDPVTAGQRTVVLCGCLSRNGHLAGQLSASGVDVVRLTAPDETVDKQYAYYAVRLLDLLKQPAAQPSQSRTFQVVVSGQGDDALLEGLGGLLRCAALEQGELSCQIIVAEGTQDALADKIAQDAMHARDEQTVLYRDNHRHIRRWQELVTRRPATASQWSDNGVYLLTGGAGGLGLHVARAIAEAAHHPKLWLSGRSALKAETHDLLVELEGLGATVRYRQVDVTNLAAVSDLLDEIETADGALNGVIHGAGLTRDGLIQTKTEQTLREVLAPKVTGVCVLDEALGNRRLDFLLLFASAAGALGNPGQSDYAAANAFLDRFAVERNTRLQAGRCGGTTIAVDWPYWRDGGMEMDARTISMMERQAGVRPLDTGPGLAALNTILARRDPQVLVLEGDHQRLREMVQPVSPLPISKPAVTQQASDLVKRSELQSASGHREEILAKIKVCFSRCLGVPVTQLTTDDTIDRFGVDSVSALEVIEALEEFFGSLPQTILFEVQTLGGLADELIERGAAAAAVSPEAPDSPTNAAMTQISAPETITPQPSGGSVGDIAIIAAAGRFPGADTIEDFADVLKQGRDCITEIPAERAELMPRFSPRKGEPDSSYCKWGGFLSDVDRFDAEFFGYAPKAADLADPQERLFLETTWHLLERAGHTRKHLAKHYGKRIGVFAGAMYQQYSGVTDDEGTRKQLALTSYSSVVNRVSFFFDLQGPSVAVDSMCSSGLQAVHQACQSLKSGECKLAIAGGVNLTLHPAKYEVLSRAGLVGSHPDSRAFSGGDGYLPAEAVGAVLLKPLADALKDGDQILGVIKGSLANHGGHSAGYGVPNVDAQVGLLEEAFAASGIDPATIGYVEAAATGSRIGDAIELRALTKVYADQTKRQTLPSIGSVKTQIGHAEAASGLAQLIKVLLQFEHQELFPSTGFGSAATLGLFHGTPFRPQAHLAPWRVQEVAGQMIPRRAAISSFGAGGSNVHLILEEGPVAPQTERHSEEARPRQFPVSARTPEQLLLLRERLAAYVRSAEPLSMAALSRTLRTGREPFACALMIVASTREELLVKLEDNDLLADQSCIAADWADEDDGSGAMLILPEYPFARERHWLPQSSDGKPTLPSPHAVKDLSEQVVDGQPGPVDAGETLPFIKGLLAGELGCRPDEFDVDASLANLGLESMGHMRLAYAIEEKFGLSLSEQPFDAQTTLQSLAAFIDISVDQPCRPEEVVVERQCPSGEFRAPMSETQKGLWVLQSLYPEDSTYNVPLAFKCQALDNIALQKAADWLIGAYPILGAQVVDDGEEPVLSSGLGCSALETVALPKEVEAREFVSQRVQMPFDLSTNVFRIERFFGGSLAPNESIVVLTAHHLVIDGVSSAVISRKFWDAYRHYADSAAVPTSPAGADYADFVAWETSFIRSEDGQAQKQYWLEKLSGYTRDLRIADASAVGADKLPHGQTAEHKLSSSVSVRVLEAARTLGISPAAFYLTVFSVLLYRYSGDEDLVIGVPTLRRPAGRFAETVGYCANMIAMRIGVDPEKTFNEFCRSIATDFADGLKQSDFPFAAIAREIGGTETGAVPYQVTFAYQNFAQGNDEPAVFSEGKVVLIPEIRQVGGEDLGLEVQHNSEGSLLIATYDSNRYSREFIRRLFGHFNQLLEGALEQSEMPLSKLPLLTKAEAERAMNYWNTSGRGEEAGPAVHELIFANARKMGSSLAVADGQKNLSYKALAARCKKIALVLNKAHVQPGDRVGVVLGRETDGIATMLAVLSMGAVWVPIDTDYPDERIGYILKDAGCTTVVSSGQLAKRLEGLASTSTKIIDLEKNQSGLLDRFAGHPKRAVLSTDPAYIIYTSGSTGAPKGVVVSHGALSGHVRVISTEYGLSISDVVLQFAPTAVDTAIEQILPVLVTGGRLVLRPTELLSADGFLKFLRDAAITVADLPPVYLYEVLRSWTRSRTDLSELDLRLMIVGGEVLTPELAKEWHTSGLSRIRLVNAYGPTEATITALVHTVKPLDLAPSVSRGQTIPIGRPLPGTEVYILDPDGNIVPDGIVGELHLGGDRLAIGYHERRDVTAEKFRDHKIGHKTVRLYGTGDLACYLYNSGGVIAFRGRVDDQVKIRGHRVELAEIEAAVQAGGVAEAAVVGKRKRSGEIALTAYVGEPELSYDEDRLRQHLAARLPEHMMPSNWVRLDNLPKTASGKIDRKSLSASKAPAPQLRTQGPAPRDQHEQDVLVLWREVLDLAAEEHLAIDSDFADAGGHSLLTIRLLNGLKESFNCSLSVRDLAHARTITAQAQLLRARGAVASGRQRVSLASGNASSSLVVSLSQTAPEVGGANARPICLFHPVSGMLGCYQEMVEVLSAHRSVLGLRAMGLEAEEDISARSIDDLAEAYCGQIRVAQPQGPYTLCGWSFGGVVAYEVACKLISLGAEVASLVLIDSFTPADVRRAENTSGRSEAALIEDCKSAFLRDLFGVDVALLPGEDVVEKAMILPQLDVMLPGIQSGELNRLYRVFEEHFRAFHRHRLRPSDVPLTLVRATESLSAGHVAGWGVVTSGAVEEIHVAGDHYSLLRHPALGSWLSQAFDQGRDGDSC
ncbi:amino acid adenylation domain-containing protein [Roseibium sp. CAU 1637]|uniref:Amino acid adenylation domain-containing protein n=1 Tax=Roseibium limicola TaxID=2816037 RepID=A0A939ELE0_9HYPH|nr:non-ribosomal peptide synthetase [Roseibium limicola]MBO0344280.1 amino acid adenylation domain-containing protein [Roseibium limicola]